MSIPFDVHAVAAHARIAITEKEASTFQVQLEQVLERIKQLKAIDTSAVEDPMISTAPIDSTTRQDFPESGLTKSDVLWNTSLSSDGLFTVSKVIT